MPMIKSSEDLRNCYNEISALCHEYAEPVFITKNGKGDLAVMSIEAYEELIESIATDATIFEAEAEFALNGQQHDARSALSSLRRKHFG
jgi:PHD/YefM family antitoxin component YafN of YafNO toxin-antitoxin module